VIYLTVDVEEWFHLCRAERHLSPSRWPELPHRARESVQRLLEILADRSATFFVLGYVARRDPRLIREIAAAGHEIASHGFGHRTLDRLSPAEFRRDLRESIAAIGDACGVRPRGFRAPEWSARAWMYGILAEEGFEFDSSRLSLRPRPHRRGGVWEFPVSPFLNGTSIRLLPARVLDAVAKTLRTPAVVAVHPWDLDPGFPRLRFPLVRGALHYVNRHRTEGRLKALLQGRTLRLMSPPSGVGPR